MRTVHEQYAPLLEGTVELIVKCFAAVRYPKLLDSATQVSHLLRDNCLPTIVHTANGGGLGNMEPPPTSCFSLRYYPLIPSQRVPGRKPGNDPLASFLHNLSPAESLGMTH